MRHPDRIFLSRNIDDDLFDSTDINEIRNDHFPVEYIRADLVPDSGEQECGNGCECDSCRDIEGFNPAGLGSYQDRVEQEERQCDVHYCTNWQTRESMGEVDTTTAEGHHQTLLVCDGCYERMAPKPHKAEQEVQGESERIAEIIRNNKDDYPENVLHRVAIELRNMGHDVFTTKQKEG